MVPLGLNQQAKKLRGKKDKRRANPTAEESLFMKLLPVSMSYTNSTATLRNTISNHSHGQNDENVLLPGLPNHLAQLCLSPLHPSLLYAACSSWRRLIYSPSFPHFFSLYALLSPSSSRKNHCSRSTEFFSYDPIASKWQCLPRPPAEPPLHFLHRHPSFISRNMPIRSVTVSGRLVMISATAPNFLPALSQPLVFDPLCSSSHWSLGPPMASPRRWCAAGSVGGEIYVASGVGACYRSDVARSLEKWDMNEKNFNEWKWESKAGLKDGRFTREDVETVGYKGKLWLVNVKGLGVKQGGVYEAAEDKWEEMPSGMMAGWNGPAAATDDGGEMYTVDEEKGCLRKYDPEGDSWIDVLECSEHFKGAVQIAAGRGRVCIVCSGGKQIVVVDAAAMVPRTWVVQPPPEMEVVSVHVLPRMSLPD